MSCKALPSVWLSLFCLLALTSGGLAQSRSLGTISGAVSDSTGAVLESATVTATNASNGWKASATTDAHGNFHFDGLPLTGTYTLRVEKTGFSPTELKSLQLRAGATSEIAVTLGVAAQNATIDVTGTADAVNASNPQIQTRLDLPEINNTPVLGRELSTLVLLDSSVRPARGTGDLFLGSTLFVIGASGRRQTTFAVDNATANDTWGRQTFFTAVPFDSVQEFSILPSAFSAEYGRTTGGAINIVTKSGTNAWHGDLGALWRPSQLEANAPLAIGRSVDRLAQGFVTISGPVVRNRTFFLVSNEYTNQLRDSAVTSSLGPGVFTGQMGQNLLFTRLDQRWSDRHSSFLRVGFDRMSDTNPADAVGGLNLPSVARTFSRRTYSAVLSDTLSLTSNLLSEARFQFQLGSPMSQFVPQNPSTQYVRPGLGTEGESRVNNILNHQYEFADTLSWVRGRHIIRFGADVIYTSNGGYGQEFGGGFTLGQFTLQPGVTKPISELTPTLADIQRYIQSFGNMNYNVKEALVAGFIQDDFRVSQALTLNLGIRYEKQTLTDSNLGFAPRIGFAYRMPLHRATVLRGGFGIFQSELRSNIAAGYKINGPEGIFTFSAAPGQTGFPTDLQPLAEFPAGAVLPPRDITVRVGDAAQLSQFLDVSKLRYYPDALLNPYTEQWTLGVERELSNGTILSINYLGQHSVKLDRPVDLNAPDPIPAGQARSAAQADATRPIAPVPNGFKRIIATVNAGSASYNGLSIDLKKRLSTHFGGLLSYTWSHAINTVEPDVPQQDPNDSNFPGQAEKASSLLDQRHRVSASGWYELPHKFVIGTWISAASGRPYNVTTGRDTNGDGANSDRPVINGVLVPRNWGQGTATYDISAFAQKTFRVREGADFILRAEGFNLTNTANIVGRNGVYCVKTPGSTCTFGDALGGMANVDPGRQFQFQVRFAF